MRTHGLGLRGQLIIALVVVFGAAFFLLSVVSARLDLARQQQEHAQQQEVVQELRRAASTNDSEALNQLGDDLDARHRTQTHEATQRNSVFSFYLGLTALSVLLLAYVLLTYLIVRPVGSITRASETLALGRLETEVPVRGAAEVARLAVAFNDMASQLRTDRATLQERLEELERTTIELTEAREQVIRADRLAAVGRLSAGVAHEIGNPLAAIQGLLDLVADADLTEPERNEFLTRVRGETERIHNTIRDLLDFSRDESTSTERAASCGVEGVVEATIRLIERQNRFENVKFIVDLPITLPAVRGSQERLRQLLLNLFFNAADAMNGQGELGVSASVDADVVALRISDTGPGIAEAVLDQVFDPFVTTKPAGQGTGLGLSICHAIADRLGGSIHVHASGQTGTTFEVRLPTAN